MNQEKNKKKIKYSFEDIQSLLTLINTKTYYCFKDYIYLCTIKLKSKSNMNTMTKEAKFITTDFDERRCIIKVEDCIIKNFNGKDYVHSVIGTGLNGNNELCINYKFGVCDNIVRESTSEEISELYGAILKNEYYLNEAKKECKKYIEEISRKEELKKELINLINSNKCNLKTEDLQLMVLKLKINHIED